ncbi:Holliday junction resolvase [Secundilactobacillus pentosiphilus]|uniref:Holliday junction resolvase n=1 Tax=Secundilactobacillus pentosiphilus TaxID=1714682 RepID=A0A1Z5IYF3_9LACO|nr:RusA family crossover junction endodeoxyribonuclease [Secundilactobacillus pentosiphilus]GAX06824.1 Holliday junction resolvase [Secundilactobacillus pentosiphilus]
MIVIRYDGEPVPAGRPRFTRKGHAYDPGKSRKFKELLGWAARSQYHEAPITGKPLEVYIEAYRANQKNISKVERRRRENKVSVPMTKPDVDNYVKSILDALTGIIWEDDNLIQHVDARKYYADQPHVIIKVKEYKREFNYARYEYERLADNGK